MWSENYRAPLIQVANSIQTDPENLRALIAFESSWNPEAYNRSGAVGLIQFMPQTLKGMGVLSAALAAQVPDTGMVPETVKQAVRAEFLAKYPNVESQLFGPVLSYFLPSKPYPSAQSLNMKVFYPAFRNVSPDTAFPAFVQAANPGIDTVADYNAAVKKKSSLKISPVQPSPSQPSPEPSAPRGSSFVGDVVREGIEQVEREDKDAAVAAKWQFFSNLLNLAMKIFSLFRRK